MVVVALFLAYLVGRCAFRCNILYE